MDNSPLFRIFALTITILYELRLKNESKVHCSIVNKDEERTEPARPW